jgi:hypothetical protein
MMETPLQRIVGLLPIRDRAMVNETLIFFGFPKAFGIDKAGLKRAAGHGGEPLGAANVAGV